MLQALLHLLGTQPQLLAEHAQAYGELAAAEAGAVASQWRRRLVLLLLALCLGGSALTLAGVALLLWAITPPAQIAPGQVWLLWAAPLLPALAAATCLLAARAPDEARAAGPFRDLREQLRADVAMLRQASGDAP